MDNRTTAALALAALALVALALWTGGPALALEGLLEGGMTLLKVTPLLLFAFLLAGLVQTLVTRELITRWLGAESGWRGIALACIGGALMPGGPYVYFPIAAAIFKAGANLGVLIAFVTAKNLWAVSRLPLEFAVLGPRVTIVRRAVTLILPPLLGFLAEGLLGRRVGRIREAVVS